MLRVIFCICLLVLPSASFAAFKSSQDGIAPDSATNPRPLADDIMLPLPCGLSMALRAVDVPQGELVRDRSFSMGIANVTNADRKLYERQFTGYIAAPFTPKDLPAGWQGKLSAGDGAGYYFIGKYEVSRLQWQAVMDAVSADGEEKPYACPAMTSSGGNLPVGGVSWFETQDFLRRLNGWLARYHPEDLPRFSGTQNIGFLRLPTEEEWEYAARGGARVPQEWWADKDIFPLEKDRELKDYGVYNYGVTQAGPAAIGSRHANPLGIHDTLGNMREMVDGFFRLSIADMMGGSVTRRLHGAAGGILCKGGSYQSLEEDIMPGSRDEIPIHTAKGPSHPNDLGLRLVVAGLNIPNAERLAELRKEDTAHVRRIQEQAAPVNVESKTPLDALDALASAADERLRPGLMQLRGLLEDQSNAEERRQIKSLEHSFRSLLYLSETLRAFAYRYVSTEKEVAGMRDLLRQKLSPENRAKAERVLAQANEDMEGYLKSLRMGANYYKTSLGVALEAQRDDVDRLLAQMRREYGGDDIFSTHMRQDVNILSTYLAQARHKGLSALDSMVILKGIIPPRHYRALPL